MYTSGIGQLPDCQEVDPGVPCYLPPAGTTSVPFDSGGAIGTTPPFMGGGIFGGGSTPGGTNFWTALTQGIANATSILGTRYAVPQLNPGQVIQTGPGGTTFMSQAAAGGALTLPSSIGGVGIGTVLLLGGGLLLVMMMAGGKSKG